VTGNCRSVQQLWVLDLRTREARLVLGGVSTAVYAETGHILYARLDGGLFALPFDPGSMEVQGDAISLRMAVKIDRGIVVDLAVSQEGTALMMPAPDTSLSTMEAVWIERDGRARPI